MSKYVIEEEASGAICEIVDDLNEAIADAQDMHSRDRGHYLVCECSTEKIVFDTNPDVTHKI